MSRGLRTMCPYPWLGPRPKCARLSGTRRQAVGRPPPARRGQGGLAACRVSDSARFQFHCLPGPVAPPQAHGHQGAGPQGVRAGKILFAAPASRRKVHFRVPYAARPPERSKMDGAATPALTCGARPICNSTYGPAVALLRPVFSPCTLDSSAGWVTRVAGSVSVVHGAESGDVPRSRCGRPRWRAVPARDSGPLTLPSR